jgi:hypothetical protein
MIHIGRLTVYAMYEYEIFAMSFCGNNASAVSHVGG